MTEEKITLIDKICTLHPSLGVDKRWSEYTGGMKDSGKWYEWEYFRIKGFKKGITGDFKKPYNKLDIETVLDWLHEYDSKERLYLLEKRDHNKKMEAKQLQESFKEVSKEFVSGMIKKIAEENNIEITSKDEVSEKEKAYQAYKLKYLNSKK